LSLTAKKFPVFGSLSGKILALGKYSNAWELFGSEMQYKMKFWWPTAVEGSSAKYIDDHLKLYERLRGAYVQMGSLPVGQFLWSGALTIFSVAL